MKLILLHGLGQDVLSWQGVQFALSPLHSKTFDIFSHPKESSSGSQRKVDGAPPARKRTLYSGRTLTGRCSRSRSLQPRLATLKGLVLSGTQYKLNTNLLYWLQVLLFRMIPKRVFEKQGANKQHMLQIFTELKTLNLTDTAKLSSP